MDYSAVFLLLVVFSFTSSLCSRVTPANSGSIMIRPQYSQTMIFLRERISNCLWGGILLKQPPQASRCTYTIPNPLREFLRIRLKDWSKRGSILVSSSLALSLSFSSSCLVSEMISSSSFFLTSRSFCLSSNALCSLQLQQISPVPVQQTL